jgi:hypothetical protein
MTSPEPTTSNGENVRFRVPPTVTYHGACVSVSVFPRGTLDVPVSLFPTRELNTGALRTVWSGLVSNHCGELVGDVDVLFCC